MRTLTLLLFTLLPGALSGQEGYVGILGGRTAAQLSDNTNHFGSMAGAFFQVDLSHHVGIRSEASWSRTGALSNPDLYSCHDCRQNHEPVDLDYAELNIMGRLSWGTTRLQPLDAEVGLTVFGGGWLGARLRGQVTDGDNRVGDFGHLLGVGLFWKYERLVLQVDARSYHGERGLTPDGPTRRGSQLVFGLGYRIHGEGGQD